MNAVGTTGPVVNIVAAENVILQDMVIAESTVQGVKDGRQSPGTLIIKDTVIEKNAGAGVVAAGASGTVVFFDNVTSTGNTYGLAVAAGNQAHISRSRFSGNSVAGVEADGGSFVVVDSSSISKNNVGIQSGSAIRLSNDDITFNTTAVSGATGTFGNNRFSGNGSDGTALTPVGSGTTDLGEK